MMAVFQLQTNGQYERFDTTLVSLHQLQIVNNQQNWNIFVQRPRYAYKRLVSGSAYEKKFNLTPSRQSPGPVEVVSSSTIPNGAGSAKSSNVLLQKIFDIVAPAQGKL